MREFTNFKKGINLGGWISQCGTENYNDKYYNSFIKSEDFDKITKMGVDHVRLPIDYNVIMTDDGEFIKSGFAYIDFCIEMCRKNGLAIVLDLHKTAGFVFDDEKYCQFFEDVKLQDMFISLWLELTRFYGNSDDIAFELLNEITDPNTAQKWNEIAKRTITEIRKVSKTVKIIIGGIFNSSIHGLTLLEKPVDENIVFTYHCYSPMVFTHQKAEWVAKMPSDFGCVYPLPESELYSSSHDIFGSDYDNEFDKNNTDFITSEYFERMFKQAINIAEKYDVPLYCGEYGVIDKADIISTINWYNDINSAFEKFGIARAAWTYKGKDFGVSDERLDNVFSEICNLL